MKRSLLYEQYRNSIKLQNNQFGLAIVDKWKNFFVKKTVGPVFLGRLTVDDTSSGSECPLYFCVAERIFGKQIMN
jgi:hypothetical protein